MKDSIFLKSILLFLFSGFLGTAVMGGIAAPGKERLKIVRVGLDSKAFDPSKSEEAVLGFEVTKQSDVYISIHDRLGWLVRSFDLPDANAGRHSITWDGRDADGKLAVGNVFLYVIEAESKSGGRAVYNPALETGGFEVKTLEYTFDSRTGEIEYVLPKASMIRMRAGLGNGMCVKTIFDWKPSTAGRHKLEWDGKDDSGCMNFLRHRDLELGLSGYTLPANTIIFGGETVSFATPKNHAGLKERNRFKLWGANGKYFHYRHNPGICHEPRFSVLFPTAVHDSKGVPIVSGIVPIRVDLDPRDVQHLINTKFEVMLFIDGVFVYEIEEGSSPFTFNWDSSAFAKNSCIITVNVMSYDDHIGVVSRKVIVGE